MAARLAAVGATNSRDGLRTALSRERQSPYSTQSYNRTIQRHIKLHKRDAWIPLQIRHARLTEIAAAHGPEGSRTVANHRHLKTTDIYLERDRAKARKIMDDMG